MPVTVMTTEWADTIAQDYFIFLDESGNYDFSPKGTSHLVYTAISSGQVHAGIEDIHALKHWLIACGQELEYFHATEDFQIVRDEVFKVICALPIRVDTIVVEKRKAGPSIRPIERLYPKMFEILLRYLLKGLPRQPDRLQIFCDTPDNKKSKRAVEKGIKLALAPLASSVAYSVLLHASKSHPYLQVADYCGWAIYRKWEGSGLSILQTHHAHGQKRVRCVSERNQALVLKLTPLATLPGRARGLLSQGGFL